MLQRSAKCPVILKTAKIGYRSRQLYFSQYRENSDVGESHESLLVAQSTVYIQRVARIVFRLPFHLLACDASMSRMRVRVCSNPMSEKSTSRRKPSAIVRSVSDEELVLFSSVESLPGLESRFSCALISAAEGASATCRKLSTPRATSSSGRSTASKLRFAYATTVFFGNSRAFFVKLATRI